MRTRKLLNLSKKGECNEAVIRKAAKLIARNHFLSYFSPSFSQFPSRTTNCIINKEHRGETGSRSAPIKNDFEKTSLFQRSQKSALLGYALFRLAFYHIPQRQRLRAKNTCDHIHPELCIVRKINSLTAQDISLSF